MRKYGCFRNIWEGGIEGEGFLRKYKGELKNGLKHNWQIWSIKTYYNRMYSKKRNLKMLKRGKQHWHWSVGYISNILHSLIYSMMANQYQECLIITTKKYIYVSVSNQL